MVAAFDYCLHGKGGAAPSIDTAMHALVDAEHVDHLHPDSGIAFATAEGRREAHREGLRRQGASGCRGVAPASSSGSTSPRSKTKNPDAIGCILGGHGITAWGDTSAEAEKNSLWIIDTAQAYIDKNGSKNPFGRAVAKNAALEAGRAPREGGRARADDPRHRVARQPDGRPLHRRPARARLPRLGERAEARRARHQLPRPLPAHQGQADAARPARGRVRRGVDRAPEGAAREVPRRLHEVLREARDVAGDAPRSAAPTRSSCSCPASACSRYGANKQTARVAGEFYLNAINVMRGAEALSTYTPDLATPRSSASSTGRSKRPSCSGCRSRSPTRRASRS